MARKKTKKQKKQTASKRKSRVALKKDPGYREVKQGFDMKLIRGDLIRTVIVSLVILGVELLLYFYLR